MEETLFDPDEEEKLIQEFDWNSYYEYSERQESREQDQYLNWYECNEEPGVEKRTFQIETSWIMTATVSVEAETLEDAIAEVEAMEGLPSEGEYLSGSFQVDEDLTRENNGEEAG